MTLDIARLRELLEKATPGPWSVADNRGMNGALWIEAEHPEAGLVSHAKVRSGCAEADDLGSMEANAELIALAPIMVKALLTAAENAEGSAIREKGYRNTITALAKAAERAASTADQRVAEARAEGWRAGIEAAANRVWANEAPEEIAAGIRALAPQPALPAADAPPGMTPLPPVEWQACFRCGGKGFVHGISFDRQTCILCKGAGRLTRDVVSAPTAESVGESEIKRLRSALGRVSNMLSEGANLIACMQRCRDFIKETLALPTPEREDQP